MKGDRTQHRNQTVGAGYLKCIEGRSPLTNADITFNEPCAGAPTGYPNPRAKLPSAYPSPLLTKTQPLTIDASTDWRKMT